MDTLNRDKGSVLLQTEPKMEEEEKSFHTLKRLRSDAAGQTQVLSDLIQSLLSTLNPMETKLQSLHKAKLRYRYVGVITAWAGALMAVFSWGISYYTITSDEAEQNDEDHDEGESGEIEEPGIRFTLSYIGTTLVILGSVIKIGNALICKKKNKKYKRQLAGCVGGSHLKALDSQLKDSLIKIDQQEQMQSDLHQRLLDSALSEEIEDKQLLRKRTTSTKPMRQDTEESEETSPVAVQYLETIDNASSAPDILTTVYEYCDNIDSLEPLMDWLEPIWETLTSDLGEVCPYVVFEGVTSFISLFLSSYEIYKLTHNYYDETKNEQLMFVGNVIQRLETRLNAVQKTKLSLQLS